MGSYVSYWSLAASWDNMLTKDRRRADSPKLEAFFVQAMFEQSAADSLLLYDACHSGDSEVTEDPADSLTELISACGFDSRAPGVGKTSFTNTLIRALRHHSKRGPFSVSELFQTTLHFCRNCVPRSNSTNPVHCSLTGARGGRRIMLHPLTATPKQPAAIGPESILTVGFTLEYQQNNRKEWEEWVLSAPADAREVFLRVGAR